MLKAISPTDAARLMRENGAVLVDIREVDEHARERIPGAASLPLSMLDRQALATGNAKAVLFHCRSGARTQANAAGLVAKAAGCEAYVVEGGIDAWKAAGLPVALDTKQPIEIMRQVQITAGSLVVLGVVLGALVNPWFYGISAFVGAGLVFSGASGSCAMAAMLRYMPWNKTAVAVGSPVKA